jgi:hypothetical protein
MVRHVGPFRRYLWLEGPPSEPPDEKSFRKNDFFFIGSFGRFLVFFLPLPCHPFCCFGLVHTLTCPVRHTPPLPILLHTPLAPIPHYTFPPPVPLTPIPNLSKTSSCTLEFSLFFVRDLGIGYRMAPS